MNSMETDFRIKDDVRHVDPVLNHLLSLSLSESLHSVTSSLHPHFFLILFCLTPLYLLTLACNPFV